MAKQNAGNAEETAGRWFKTVTQNGGWHAVAAERGIWQNGESRNAETQVVQNAVQNAGSAGSRGSSR